MGKGKTAGGMAVADAIDTAERKTKISLSTADRQAAAKGLVDRMQRGEIKSMRSLQAAANKVVGEGATVATRKAPPKAKAKTKAKAKRVRTKPAKRK